MIELSSGALELERSGALDRIIPISFADHGQINIQLDTSHMGMFTMRLCWPITISWNSGLHEHAFAEQGIAGASSAANPYISHDASFPRVPPPSPMLNSAIR